jgi:hypothetical protein
MTARRWWITGVGVVVVAAVVAVVSIWLVPDDSDSGCAKVRQMLKYHKAHNNAITARSDPDNPTETSLSDSQSWATRLKAYADDVADPRLAPHTHQVAVIAAQTVAVVEQARDDSAQSPVPGPPPWAQRHAQLNAQFRDELGALEQACPA